MNASTVIAVVILVLIVAAALIYIIRAKRRGVKCIGCPCGCSGGKKNEGEHHCCH